MRRPRRSNNGKPSCSSSWRICWLTALCVRCSSSAAARRLPVRAMARKLGRVCSGRRAMLVSMPYQLVQKKSIPRRDLGTYATQHRCRRVAWHPPGPTPSRSRARSGCASVTACSTPRNRAFQRCIGCGCVGRPRAGAPPSCGRCASSSPTRAARHRCRARIGARGATLARSAHRRAQQLPARPVGRRRQLRRARRARRRVRRGGSCRPRCCAARSISAAAMCASGSTSCAAPAAMASRGMPKTTQLASSWHDVVAAGVAHLVHRLRAVGAHAGEHHAERVRARPRARPTRTAPRPTACGGSPARRRARARCSWRRCARRAGAGRRARCRRGRAARARRRSASLTRMRHRPSSRAA